MINEPSILTASTYFWTSAGAAGARRSNEKKRLQEVTSYFESIGMTITDTTDNAVHAEYEDVCVTFQYSESCKNVYKSLTVRKSGKRSNITAIRKIASLQIALA
jgi:hypothetical protein